MNRMILTCLFAMAFYLLQSCEMIYFAQPQPSDALSALSFPEEWQGVYRMIDPESNQPSQDWVKVDGAELITYSVSTDSLENPREDQVKWIGSDRIQLPDQYGERQFPAFIRKNFVVFTVEKKEVLGLSDTMILKQGDQFDMINMLEKENGKDYWVGILVEKSRSGDLLLWVAESKEEIEAASQFFEMERITDPASPDRTTYVADPSAAEMGAYVASGGFRTLMAWFHRPSDLQSVPEALK